MPFDQEEKLRTVVANSKNGGACGEIDDFAIVEAGSEGVVVVSARAQYMSHFALMINGRILTVACEEKYLRYFLRFFDTNKVKK